MQYSFLTSISSVTIVSVLFIAILVIYWIAGRVSTNIDGEKNKSEDFGTVEGSLLGLLALLLAFTFSMSASRYDMRRQIMIEEANNIGTAILRADLYPDSIRQLFRVDFAAYVEARISFYEAGVDTEKIIKTNQLTNDISAKLWKRAALLGHNPANLISSNQMIPALNSMIDIITTRNAAITAKVPDSILWMLFILCGVSSFIIGYKGKKTRSAGVIVIVFSLMICSSIYLILDLDRSRRGLINMDASNNYIIELREMFK